MRAEVVIRARCMMPERLIMRAIEGGAAFSEVMRPDARTLIVGCDAVSSGILLSLCERFSIPTRVLERRGMTALKAAARRRRTLPVAIALCVLMCWAFLGRIWIVDAVFSGESAVYGSVEPLNLAIRDAGIRPGIDRDAIDPDALAQSLRASGESLSYVGVHLQGVRLLVEAVPEVPSPLLYDVDSARDLVSGLDGVVVSAVADSGELCVQPGDTVRRGQLLIRGEELTAKDRTRSIAALGEVVVRAWYEGTAALPLDEPRVEYTGRTATSSSLRLFGLSIPIVAADNRFGAWDTKTERIAIGGLFLPLELERQTIREYRVSAVPTGEERLRARLAFLARADAARNLSGNGPEDFEITQCWIDYETAGNLARARAVYEIRANAAITRAALNTPSEESADE